MAGSKLFRVDYTVTFYYPQGKKSVKENYMVVKAEDGSDAVSLLNYLWADGSPEKFCDIEDVDIEGFSNVELDTKEPVGVSPEEYSADYDAGDFGDRDEVESMKGYCKKCGVVREVYMDEMTKISEHDWEVTFACVVCDSPVLPDE